MRILLLDNYDSFTYNIVHLLEKITGERPVVYFNDRIDVASTSGFDRIILSPGPGLPAESGVMPEVISQYAGKIPMFGICLGHQAIAESFGGKLLNADKILHGVATPVHQTAPSILFNNVTETFEAGRYHSWHVERGSLPRNFTVTAVDDDGFVMAMEDAERKLYSVQFHPESVLTPAGEGIMRNWLEKI